MEGVDQQPHLQLGKAQVHPVVLVMGDPARVGDLAKFCDSATEIASNREYRTFDCQHHGVRFTATSHGVGASGAGVAFEELIKLGAKTIIRAGTCGSLQDDIASGSVIVSQAAVREAGWAERYAPPQFPAVADPEVCAALTETAKRAGLAPHTGICVTTDLFYPSPIMPSKLDMWSKAGCVCVEMEVAAMFVLGSIKGVRTGYIAVVDGDPKMWGRGPQKAGEQGGYHGKGAGVAEAKRRMLEVARDVAVQFGGK